MTSYRIPEPCFTDFNPPVYYCRRAREKPRLDGNLDKPFWKDAPWTADFRDIERDAKGGAPLPVPRFRTRAKILWDDEAVYIGAELSGDEIWGTITKRDAVIFYDNDFEVFIDPDSDTHTYVENEMNSLNTQWDLLMNKPYRDGGTFINSFDIKGLETAVLIDGEINNPRAENRKWTIEIKMPFESLLEAGGHGERPAAGDYWRMNFSRVQWQVDVVNNEFKKRINPETNRPYPEDNWVWAPTGLINIHYPELWAFVFFCREDESYSVPRDELIKWDMRRVYYKLHARFDETGSFRGGPIAGAEPITVQTTDYDFTLISPSSDGTSSIIMHTDGRTAYSKGGK
jgi:hypothetical protein